MVMKKSLYFCLVSLLFILLLIVFVSAEVSYPLCEDSDGGKDYFNKGSVVYQELSNVSEFTYPDSCEENTITEYYCDESNVAFVSYSCPGECREGGCISNECFDGEICSLVEGQIKNFDGKEIQMLSISDNSVELSIGEESSGSLVQGDVTTLEGYTLETLNISIGVFAPGFVKFIIIKQKEDSSTPTEERSGGSGLGGATAKFDSAECAPGYICSISPIGCPDTGIQVKTCKDIKCNMEDSIEEMTCDSKLDEIVFSNKEIGDGCIGGHQCGSGICLNDECVTMEAVLQEIPEVGFFKELLMRIKCRFSHFISTKNFNGCLAESLRY